MHHKLTSPGLPAQIHLRVLLPPVAQDALGVWLACTLSGEALKGKDRWASCLPEMHRGAGAQVLPRLGTKKPEWILSGGHGFADVPLQRTESEERGPLQKNVRVPVLMAPWGEPLALGEAELGGQRVS